jgi:hypothetical protein
MKYSIRVKKGSYTSPQLGKMWDQGSVDAETEYYDELRLEWLPLQFLIENTAALFSAEEAFVRLGESRSRGCLCIYNREERINIFVDGGFVVSALGGSLEGEFALGRALHLDNSSYEWTVNAEPPASNLRVSITAYALEHSIARDVRIGSSANQKQSTKTLGMELRDKIAPKSNYVLVSVANPEQKFPFAKGTNIVGRDKICDIIIDEPNVSRKHCLLEIGEQCVKVKDLESNNGVSINEVLTKEGQLKVGDRLGLGVFQLVLKEEKAEKGKTSQSTRIPEVPMKGLINNNGFYESAGANSKRSR